VQVRSQPSLKDQRRLAERTVRPAGAVGSPGQSAQREEFCLRMLIDQPDRLYAANRRLRELQGTEAELAKTLAPLSTEDFSRTEHQEIFRHLVRSLYQDEVEPLEYLYQQLSPELIEVVDRLRVEPLAEFQQALSKALVTELQSIVRDQARINTLPELNTTLFIQDTLALRHSRLERESQNLYFWQQEAQTSEDGPTDQHYQAQVEANRRSRQLIAKSLQQMRGFARNG
jgi:hypothetical protein